MLLECPTRHRVRPRLSRVGARHVRRVRPRRPSLGCALDVLPPQTPEALGGSFDPVWTAGAEARLINGALRANSRNPLVIGGRILLLLAILAPALGPLKAALLHLGSLPAPFAVGVASVGVWAVSRLLLTRRS